MKDRLIGLINNGTVEFSNSMVKRSLCEYIADYLLANGVTVQEWISVKDRLPKKDVLVLCIGKRGGMFLGDSPHLFNDGTAYFSVPNARSCRYATHWMPMPHPPKGE